MLCTVYCISITSWSVDHIPHSVRALMSPAYLDLIHELHGLNDADSLALSDLVPLLTEVGLPRSGGPVEATSHGRGHLHSCLPYHDQSKPQQSVLTV